MRGSARLVTFMSVFCLLAHVLLCVVGLRCDRAPSSGAKSPADGRFSLIVAGSPDKYIPGEVYTVTLQGQHTNQVPNKFVGFLLVTEGEVSDPVAVSLATGQDGVGDAGTFQIFSDSLTKYSDKCPNAVTHTSTMPKNEIQVYWTAPSPGSGCVTLKAMVVEHHDIWYMDDGPLSKTLCEEKDDALDTQPMIVDPCCACDEAKYEVTFEGVWSRHTHPRDFPHNEWLTRFSDVIGASHSVSYRFWAYGQKASEGLRQVAEHGATRKLESELKAESEHIRTIIKARGISYPNLNGKTFAVFRVDNRHHLISLVSMIDPSPDWIVGVSGLELCLKNCSWVESKIINLYPWDAGTDSGPSYLSPDQPTTPRDVIKRIRTNLPNDPRSPFYDTEGGEMKPLARLYLSRQRLYEKTCENSAYGGAREDDGSGEDGSTESVHNGGGGAGGACSTTQWGPWSVCSATCGRGHKLKQRSYLDPARADSANCNKKLTSRQGCYGPRHNCKVPSEDEPDTATHTGQCAVSQWSQWSDCSNRCGDGVKTRSRNYRHRDAFKKCHQNYQKRPVMQQTMECSGSETDCEAPTENAEGTVLDDPNCPMTEWSDWSPCSATCGTGRQMRTRLPADRGESQRAMVRYFRKLHKRWSLWGNTEEETTEAEKESDDAENAEEGDNDNECKHMKTEEEVICHTGNKCDLTEEEARDPFGGLDSINQISSKLAGPVKTPDRTGDGSLSGVDGSTLPPYFNGEFDGRAGEASQGEVYQENVGIVRNCKVSDWSEWSQCSVTCGQGMKKRVKTILQHPMNGGKQCPRLLLKHKQCRLKPCREENTGGEEENDEDGTDPSWGPVKVPQHASEQCELSDWSPWSACTESCGAKAVRLRTRSLLFVPQGLNPTDCGHRVQTKSCGLLSCPFL